MGSHGATPHISHVGRMQGLAWKVRVSESECVSTPNIKFCFRSHRAKAMQLCTDSATRAHRTCLWQAAHQAHARLKAPQSLPASRCTFVSRTAKSAPCRQRRLCARSAAAPGTAQRMGGQVCIVQAQVQAHICCPGCAESCVCLSCQYNSMCQETGPEAGT